MPCTIWMTDLEKKEYQQVPGEPDINEILSEIKELAGETWLIMVRPYETGCLWWKRQGKTAQLLFDYSGDGHDWQVINFAAGTEWSINHWVHLHEMQNYLQAYVNGLRKINKIVHESKIAEEVEK